jgi:YggT family protein
VSDLASLLNLFFTVLTLIVLGRALLSWFDPGFKTTIGQLLVQITEPLLAPIRRLMPNTGAIDLSPTRSTAACICSRRTCRITNPTTC